MLVIPSWVHANTDKFHALNLLLYFCLNPFVKFQPLHQHLAKQFHHHHASLLLNICQDWGFYPLCSYYRPSYSAVSTFDVMPVVPSFLPSHSSLDPSLSSLLQPFLLELEWPPGTPACQSGAMCACPGKAEGIAGIGTLIPAITHPEGVIIARLIRHRSQTNECCRSSGFRTTPIRVAMRLCECPEHGPLPPSTRWYKSSKISVLQKE